MDQTEQHARIVIVGAGFSGLGMAIRLKQDGIDDFVVLERAPDVGGAWHHNSYPGCRCDVPSHLYSFSFAPNPDWSETYSKQPGIRDYLRRCADDYGIRPHLHTGVDVDSATWLEDDQRWELETSAGTYTASIVVNCMGPLSEPRLPDVPGLDSFEGTTMHSARWDHDYDFAGKRVASIGTGASAIQYVPELQREVEQLYVLQRTPPWIMPHANRRISGRERALYRRFPLAQKLVRASVYVKLEVLVLGFVKQPRLMGLLERLSRSHVHKQISDPDLARRVTPEYTLGCKRLLPSNRWYPALAAENVELVSSGLSEVRSGSVVDADGIEREVDAIVFGTGFQVTDIPVAHHVRGRGGLLLSETWAGSPRAYLGTAVPGFPNFFLMLGPNTGQGHGSMVYMIEAQIEHIRRAAERMASAGAATIEVREEAYGAFNRDVDARMHGTVWDTGGCTSFYVDVTGRNATQWPDWTWRFRRLAEDAATDAYSFGAPKPALVPA